MARGVYGVYVTVEGAKGKGTDVVPFQALLYTPGQLPLHAKLILLGAAILSTLLFIAIIRAHIIQGFLGLSAAPSNEDYRRGRIGMAVLALCLLGLFTFFFKWWDKEAQQLQKKKYHQLHISTHVEEKNDQRLLFLKIDDPDWNERLGKKLSIPFFEEPEWTDWEWLPLTLDHGKWMHIYMIREPNLDFIAHIHPIKIDESNFEAIIPPPTPPGKYVLYADVTHQNGYAETMVSSLNIPPLEERTTGNQSQKEDPDDSWYVGPPPSTENKIFTDGNYEIILDSKQPFIINQAADLNFLIRTKDGSPFELEPYMGMLSHMAIRSDDGTIFAHLHPGGTISMVAQDLFKMKEGEMSMMHVRKNQILNSATLSFPFIFPKSGPYHIWVQIKINGKVLTGLFLIHVKDGDEK